MEITVCLNQEMKLGKPPPCFARSSYSLMDSFWIAAPSENLATYRLYQISENKSSSKELEVAKQCNENLLDVRPHFCQVFEDIERNGPPFSDIQRYFFRGTSWCELPFEQAEVGSTFFRVASIVPRLWIMQMTIFCFVVCCHEVFRLNNECLGHQSFNSTFIFTFCSKHLLHPFSCVAPMILHGPRQSCLGREMQNQMLHWIKEARWKDLL